MKGKYEGHKRKDNKNRKKWGGGSRKVSHHRPRVTCSPQEDKNIGALPMGGGGTSRGGTLV